jgi:hypothetical protein
VKREGRGGRKEGREEGGRRRKEKGRKGGRKEGRREGGRRRKEKGRKGGRKEGRREGGTLVLTAPCGKLYNERPLTLTLPLTSQPLGQDCGGVFTSKSMV